jgi:hypothetical protein
MVEAVGRLTAATGVDPGRHFPGKLARESGLLAANACALDDFGVPQ